MTQDPQKEGLSIDTSPFQWLVVVVLFVMLFVVPIIGHQLYLSEHNTSITDETYTAQALTQKSSNTTSDGGRVAGISTFQDDVTGMQYYHIPLINYDFSTDFSNPSNVLILVGGILGLVSIILVLGITFDLFKYSPKRSTKSW